MGVPVQEKSAADPRSKGHVRFAGERIPVPSSSELPLEPIKAVRVEKPAARNFTAGGCHAPCTVGTCANCVRLETRPSGILCLPGLVDLLSPVLGQFGPDQQV